MTRLGCSLFLPAALPHRSITPDTLSYSTFEVIHWTFQFVLELSQSQNNLLHVRLGPKLLFPHIDGAKRVGHGVTLALSPCQIGQMTCNLDSAPLLLQLNLERKKVGFIGIS